MVSTVRWSCIGREGHEIKITQLDAPLNSWPFNLSADRTTIGRLVPLSKEKPILDASCIQSNVAPMRARLAVCWEIPFSIPPAQRNAIKGPGSSPTCLAHCSET